jgi:transcriptional regulator with XRE-family HTH domain
MMRAMASDTGRRIRKRRQVLGMTQAALGAAVGVSESTVANWERGRHFPLRYQGKLEHILGITLDDDDGTPGLPSIVAENSDLYVVTVIWGTEALTAAERLGLIRDWLRRNHPERLGDAEEPAG